jgi:SAM-dependent methyltransferase
MTRFDDLRRLAADEELFPEATGAEDQWQRIAMNEAITAHIDALGPESLRAAEISGASHKPRPWKEHTSLNYPAFDLCAPLGDQGTFDVVICEQVLEHVVDPFAAARNLRGLTVPGGHVIVSTPFLIKVHELALFAMHDYWRFTPRGLQRLLEAGGLEVDEVHTWGNVECVVGNLRRWSGYREWHTLDDDPEVAVQVWAYARNPR